VKLALDHHYTKAIAEQLRAKAHDVVAAVERGWEREDDEPLLAICESEQRALVTNNVSDFTGIAQRWASQTRSHAGLILTSDAGLPRTRATIGTYVRLLDALLSEHPQHGSFTDRVHWL
jgi:hypothetical protein